MKLITPLKYITLVAVVATLISGFVVKSVAPSSSVQTADGQETHGVIKHIA